MSAADPWLEAVGLALLVEVGGEVAAWRCAACADPAVGGGWRSWDVTFDAPSAVTQGVVLVHLPGAEPVETFVVPSSATASGTRLVATFVVPEPATAEGGV
jgi:hypothetical protein